MSLKEFFEKVNFEKKSADDNKSMKITQYAKRLKPCIFCVTFRQEISDAYNREEQFPENHMTTDDAAKLTVKQVR